MEKNTIGNVEAEVIEKTLIFGMSSGVSVILLIDSKQKVI
jgi:hypothetical protein